MAQIYLKEDFGSITLENKMEILRDSTNSLNINDILRKKKGLAFTVAKEVSPSFGTDSSQRWIHFVVKNYSKKNINLFISIYRSYLDKSEYYLCYNDRILTKVDANWKIPYFKKEISAKHNSAKFELVPFVTYDIYILVKKTFSTWSLPIELHSQKTFYNRDNFNSLSYGILVGGMILICLISLSLYYLSQESVYIYYFLYTAFSTLSVLSLGGVLNLLFGHQTAFLTGFESQSFYLLGFAITNILFTHKLFELKKYGPKWVFYLGQILIILCIFYSILICIDIKFAFALKLFYVLIISGLVLLITIFFPLARGEILAKIYVVAFIPLIGTLIYNAVSDFGYLKQQLWIYLFRPYTVLFEISVLLIGLAYRLFDYQRKKQELEKEMAFTQIQTQETERKRLAQDLHDDLGGTLSVLKGILSSNVENKEAEVVIDKAIGDLRSISRNLLPPELASIGLQNAVRNLVQFIQSGSSLTFTFVSFGKEVRFNENKELNIYRIVSELLNNVIKHAKATKVTVQLIFHEEHLFISVEDDGVGIQTNENILGIGLKNILSRVEFLKAKFKTDSNQGGSTFILEIPF